MNAQSWFDLITMPTQDPRGLIVNPTLQNQAGATQAEIFLRSTNWLQAVAWVSPVLKVTPAPTVAANVTASNAQDFFNRGGEFVELDSPDDHE